MSLTLFLSIGICSTGVMSLHCNSSLSFARLILVHHRVRIVERMILCIESAVVCGRGIRIRVLIRGGACIAPSGCRLCFARSSRACMRSRVPVHCIRRLAEQSASCRRGACR